MPKLTWDLVWKIVTALVVMLGAYYSLERRVSVLETRFDYMHGTGWSVPEGAKQ